MKTYTLAAVENLITQYLERKGEIHILEEGVLGLGIVACQAPKTRSCIIRERYVSPWASTHSVRFYRTLPKKYLDLIDNL